MKNAFVGGVPPVSITLEMKIKKKGQKRGVEEGIEAPAPNSGASGGGEVVVEH